MFSQTILVGRLGKDPESREVGSTNVTNFTVATDYSYKGRDGDYVKKTEWHQIKVWGPQAKACAQYLKKGSLVQVIGRIETETYEKEGEKKYAVKIVADRVNFLDSKGKNTEEVEPAKASVASRPVTISDPITDEDLPF